MFCVSGARVCVCLCVSSTNTFMSGWNYTKAASPAATAGGKRGGRLLHLGSDGDQFFRGPVGFDSVCFGDVHARVVGSADLARKWSVVVTRRGDTVRTGCCKWEAMRWLLFVCLFFFYKWCVSLGCRYESEPQLFFPEGITGAGVSCCLVFV